MIGCRERVKSILDVCKIYPYQVVCVPTVLIIFREVPLL